MSRPRKEAADVFLQIDTRDGDEKVCWPWTGSTSGRDNRPYIQIDGTRWLAYRLVYTIVKGVIPDGQLVRHKCDNPLCCNPFHMELGTRSDNEQDKYARDRAGLPVAVVREIKRLLTAGVKGDQRIAEHVGKRFGLTVTREAVRNIKLGKRRTDNTARTAEEILSELEGTVRGDDERVDGLETDSDDVAPND